MAEPTSDAVGELADRRRPARAWTTPKPTQTGLVVTSRSVRIWAAEVGRQLAPLAGDAGERHDVDEAAAQPRDGLHARRRGGRRHELDQVEAGRLGLGAQRLGLLVRQVGDDHAVDAGVDRRRARRP